MGPDVVIGIFIGFVIWFLVRYLAGGIYTVDQNQRAVKTSFGRAERIPGVTNLNDPISAAFDAEEKQRYQYPKFASSCPAAPISNGRGKKSTRSRLPPRPSTWPSIQTLPAQTSPARWSRPSRRTSSTPGSPAKSATTFLSGICMRISSPSSGPSRMSSAISFRFYANASLPLKRALNPAQRRRQLAVSPSTICARICAT